MNSRAAVSKIFSAGKWRLLLIYLSLLLASHVVRWFASERPLPSGLAVREQRAVSGDEHTVETVRLAYKEYQAVQQSEGVVVLLHGSPGSHLDFASLGPQLAQRYRVIAPDLPGFGHSTQRVPDYSHRAHARYVLALLQRLSIERAHFVGYSMSGGVALHIADIAPEKVSSLTMMSAVGVQEFELLGNYHLNHAVHAAQLGAVWLLHEAVPHFGWLDDSMLGISYARNFYDSDQRPLREILKRYAGPMLIIHGEHDPMVPVPAAREAHRLVPQSELVVFSDESHFYVFGRSERQAAATEGFLKRVDSGSVEVRSTADSDRVTASLVPFKATSAFPHATGPAALVLFLLLALATLVSEDLTCIWAGVLVAEGRTSFGLAVAACLFGIVVGDILLFLAGRYFGRTILALAPFKWFIRPDDVERSSAWFRRRGLSVIFLTRFLPGTRLPTYFAAGLLKTSLFRFSLYFLLAAAVWTPLLVAAAMFLGREVIESALITEHVWWRLAVAAILLFVFVRLLIRLATNRGRRLLIARWRRLRHWEFWPPWLFYPPVLAYIGYLGLKYRSLTLFTCANPAIAEGGFVGESKSEILRGLTQTPAASQFVAPWSLLHRDTSVRARVSQVMDFMRERSLDFPIVLKPDAGERGSDVAVVRSIEEAECYLESARGDVIVQQHVPGLEYGVFYYRYPSEEHGRIFSITSKLFPSVTGDGKSNVEKLILNDPRAVCMVRAYSQALGEELWTVPAAGEQVKLIEIGTHCRGSVFLDGIEIKTAELAEAIDRLARGYDGFFFGRFDIRTASLADFQQGKNFQVVELNGVTSEATSIYDRKNSLFSAYRVLFKQWRIAFEIGHQNRLRGVQPASLWRLARLATKKWRKNGERFGAPLRPISVEADSAS